MLTELKDADTLEKFAAAIGYKPASLAYILYKLPLAAKYTTFHIAKASGGSRIIHAPTDKLKQLQGRLAATLLKCNQEIYEKEPRRPISHGFEKGRSIFTNALQHKNRRFVLNVDIENFFPTINFGRIHGYFIKNKDYQLPVKAATLIAQIACCEGRLPQGSPCSPIIANLVAHLLDVRLVRIAKAQRCTYSRYADDLTFSTNQRQFPAAIASELDGFPGSWVLSDDLLGEIARTGFNINHQKTRLQCRPGRQLVTGLTVNEKVNIRAEYYRKSRKMCSALFNHGHYYRDLEILPKLALLSSGTAASPLTPTPKFIKSMAPLEGTLSHIYYIKHLQFITSEPDDKARKTKLDNKTKYPAYRGLYKKFLYFKHFINLSAPLILCEGKTDNIYLRSALKNLDPTYPTLAEVRDEKLFSKVSFLKHSRIEHDILELSGGCGQISSFITHYNSAVYNYRFRPLKYPVVILVDNDSGPGGKGSVFAAANKFIKPPVSFTSNADFYYLCHNLYLVKTPELGPTGISCMEDLFDAATLAKTVDGKTFNPKDDKDTASQYGKMVFADRVVRADYANTNFDMFRPLLNRILAAINHYAAHKPSSAT